MAERFLPKWAKEEMERKDRQIADLTEELARSRGESKQAATAFVQDYTTSVRGKTRPVAYKNERVRFVTDGGDADSIRWIDVFVDNGGITIMGESMIGVFPQSGNHVHVGLAR